MSHYWDRVKKLERERDGLVSRLFQTIDRLQLIVLYFGRQEVKDAIEAWLEWREDGIDWFDPPPLVDEFLQKLEQHSPRPQLETQAPDAFISGPFAFVRRPNGHRGCWMRTHACVAYVACPMCGAKVGEPCISTHGPMCDTHYSRRTLYQKVEVFDPKQYDQGREGKMSEMPEQQMRTYAVEIGPAGGVTWLKETLPCCSGFTWKNAKGGYGGAVTAVNEEEAERLIRHRRREREGL